ncbi:hypothetical protein SARC_14003 [Sphaeroforma arctica JP610]|uniref:Uncharacterized protein n=1 Tax=Sphaeroforma arctica JP610 TaxID=667725 RepID=A0A0L0F9Q4_9EUKA|nr:hypothetical protein SARC_14003 [Sphaeroforma arctica JP610]KNC73440.1 hypothetical protein SARC_14003 [Sphaeroforma arctica JP610]|eukprot:XP_014147342.1 hypothetical protein SARC_14003 [Sphaeroforma arctica JP610]
MNFTVLVDYLDSSLSTELRRRRMAETSHNLGDIYDSDDMSFTSNSKDTRHSRRRRNAGEVKVGTSAGVDTKVQDLIEGLNSTGDAGNSTAAEDDMTMYYVGGAIALGLLLCCCLCCCICCCLVIKRRRENARKKTVVALSEQYMKAPGQSQSSVHVMGGSQNTPGGSAESSMSMSGKALSTNVNQNQNNRQSTRGSMRRGIPGNGLNGPNVPNRPPGNGPNVPNRPPHGNMPYNHPPQQQQPYNPQHPQFSNAMVNTHNAGPMRMSVMHNTNMPPLHQQQQQQPQQQQQSVHPGMYPPNMHQPHGPPMPQQQQLQSQQSQPKMKQQPDLQVTGGSSGFYNVR